MKSTLVDGHLNKRTRNVHRVDDDPDIGLVIVYTGKGKGKTTAALGIVLRSVGYGSKVIMIQFIKGEWYYGEISSSKRLEPEFEMIAAGRGFVGIIDYDHPFEEHQKGSSRSSCTCKGKAFNWKI